MKSTQGQHLKFSLETWRGLTWITSKQGQQSSVCVEREESRLQWDVNPLSVCRSVTFYQDELCEFLPGLLCDGYCVTSLNTVVKGVLSFEKWWSSPSEKVLFKVGSQEE